MQLDRKGQAPACMCVSVLLASSVCRGWCAGRWHMQLVCSPLASFRHRTCCFCSALHTSFQWPGRKHALGLAASSSVSSWHMGTLADTERYAWLCRRSTKCPIADMPCTLAVWVASSCSQRRRPCRLGFKRRAAVLALGEQESRQVIIEATVSSTRRQQPKELAANCQACTKNRMRCSSVTS